MNTERGLLDLIIARLPALKSGERVCLCNKLRTQSDIMSLCASDIYALAGRGGKQKNEQGVLDFDETEGKKTCGGDFDLDKIIAAAERDALLMEKRDIHYTAINDDDYPVLLKEIYDPPALLYYRGTLPEADNKLLAVVGTRKPHGDALNWTYSFCRDLGEAGVDVVSGLALGIDAIAHNGNVAGGGKSIAVLGSAVDMVYPSSNRHLASRILSGGGAIVSEYPPGEGAAKWHFPARNRIISGLCAATLVVEAPEKSGALITADFALEQNRDIWVAVAEEDKVFGLGAERLTREGAKRITRAQDVLNEWAMSYGENIN
jgi:DNA processing protein